MAKIFQTVIRRVTAAAAATTNARALVDVGLRLTNRLTARLAEVKVGVVISQGPKSLRIPQRVGVALSNIVTGTTRTDTKVGLALTNRIVAPTVEQAPAVNITQITYDLVSVKGSNAATETAVGGRTDWASPEQAEGTPDGVNAEINGSALGARGGRIDLAYANYLAKTDLTITKVELRFYIEVTNTTLNNADVRLQYDIGAGIVTLETITGDVNDLAAGRLFDITTAVGGDWSKLDALVTYCRAEAAIGELWSVQLDAVTVRVEATATDTP